MFEETHPPHNTSEHLSKGKGETTPLVFKYFYLQNALSNYAYTFQGKKEEKAGVGREDHTQKKHIMCDTVKLSCRKI